MLILAQILVALAASIAMYLISFALFECCSRAVQISPRSLLSSWIAKGLLRPVLTSVGRRLLPFMTWNQRRNLDNLIMRSGSVGLDYLQLFAAQVLLALVAVTIYWISVGVISADNSAQYGEFENAQIPTERITIGLLVAVSLCLAVFFWWLPVWWLKRCYQQRLFAIERALPSFLDIVGLALASGQNLHSALQMACEHLGDGALRSEWLKTLGDIRTGVSRRDAFRKMSLRVELASLRQLISALIQAESLGQTMAHVVEVFGAHQRAHRLMRAEKLALQAPVKMIFPLALFILPCTFLVLGFPVLVELFGLRP